MSTEKLIEMMAAREYLMRDLKLVRELRLPHWCIAAGYVRNCVWDVLHGYANRTPLNDVDVVYFDPGDPSEETEKRCEFLLKSRLAEYNWSFKNQARMHIRNGETPYRSVEDAMRRWPETATAVGISLDDNGKLQAVAPHGMDDLFGLAVRRSPYFADKAAFLRRVRSKGWLDIWPQLRLVVD
jgi:hypothetical protein